MVVVGLARQNKNGELQEPVGKPLTEEEKQSIAHAQVLSRQGYSAGRYAEWNTAWEDLAHRCKAGELGAAATEKILCLACAAHGIQPRVVEAFWQAWKGKRGSLDIDSTEMPAGLDQIEQLRLLHGIAALNPYARFVTSNQAKFNSNIRSQAFALFELQGASTASAALIRAPFAEASSFGIEAPLEPLWAATFGDGALQTLRTSFSGNKRRSFPELARGTLSRGDTIAKLCSALRSANSLGERPLENDKELFAIIALFALAHCHVLSAEEIRDLQKLGTEGKLSSELLPCITTKQSMTTERALGIVQFSAARGATASWLAECWKLLQPPSATGTSGASQATREATAALLQDPKTATATFTKLPLLIPNQTERLQLLTQIRLPADALKAHLTREILSQEPWSPDHALEIIAAVSALEPRDTSLCDATLLNGLVSFAQELKSSKQPHEALYCTLMSLKLALGNACTPYTQAAFGKAELRLTEEQRATLAKNLLRLARTTNQ